MGRGRPPRNSAHQPLNCSRRGIAEKCHLLTQVHMHPKHTHTHARTHMHTHIPIHRNQHTLTYLCIHTCTHRDISGTQIHIHVYTHIYPPKLT